MAKSELPKGLQWDVFQLDSYPTPSDGRTGDAPAPPDGHTF